MNKLQHETSPYLKQHENNPVHWYPWGEEALQKAREEDKPILVSIGYSACHWCHVMAHECFENEQLAGIMNAYFINIKIDREERPDVDAIYMDALHAMGIRGGWPLNVFLMPDAKPFYGGTYFPPKNWQNILLGIQNAFQNEREKLQESAESFAQNLNTKDSARLPHFDLAGENKDGWSEQELDMLLSKLKVQFDTQKGGLERAPKFPMPSIWEFLTECVIQEKDAELENQLRLTLDRIALGGIFDHISGGWTRYSTDADWKVPHFEKMLYDNGQLLELYASTLSRFQNAGIFDESQRLYRWAIDKTVAWLGREMTDASGAFFSALDADSEGEEGKFYVWSKAEIETLTDDPEFLNLYEISAGGNWEHGNNVLHLEKIPDTGIWEMALRNHQTLFQATKNRIRPGLDNKILCNWNALTISGLVASYKVAGDESMLNMALGAAEFILDRLSQEVGEGDQKAIALWHMYAEDLSRAPFGFLDDYAACIKAFTDLYQVSFDEKWLSASQGLVNYVLANFFDKEEGLFFYTDVQSEKLIARKKELYDNVIPASNSLLANALFDLGVLTSDDGYLELASSMFAKIRKLAVADPAYMSHWALLGLKMKEPGPEVVIAGKNAEAFRKELAACVKRRVYFAGSSQSSDLPLLKERYSENHTYIYVCQNRTCHMPVQTVEEALKVLDEL